MNLMVLLAGSAVLLFIVTWVLCDRFEHIHIYMVVLLASLVAAVVCLLAGLYYQSYLFYLMGVGLLCVAVYLGFEFDSWMETMYPDRSRFGP